MPPRKQKAPAKSTPANGKPGASDGTTVPKASGDASASAAVASSSTPTAVAYPSVSEAKDLVAELCASFYELGWVSGTGGGLSMRAGPGGESVVMAPSGVQKERMRSSDMFVLRASDGVVVETPRAPPPPAKQPKLSECAPLFMSAYELRGAGAVVHSHSLNAVAATMIQGEHSSSFKATHLEMCKGVDGHGFRDVVEVPIVENTARECELTERLRAAIAAYPRSNAVLVRRHGVYVWGSTWERAKAQAETYDYLFEAALRLKEAAGVDVSVPPPGAKEAEEADAEEARAREGAAAEPARKRARADEDGDGGGGGPRCVVVDIEGTVLPISHVKDVMFPYARERLRSYLEAGYLGGARDETVWRQVEQLRCELAFQANIRNGGGSFSTRPVDEAERRELVEGCVAHLESLMDRDVKATSLKSVQASIWTQGFRGGQLKAPLFADVAPALKRWSSGSSKVYVYSSGDRIAQRDLFSCTSDGDLRRHLSGFFDTTSGPKVESRSYEEIALSLGVYDPAKEILFLTDVLAEAVAAKKAGWGVALVSREGNAPLPEGHGFRVIESFDELF